MVRGSSMAERLAVNQDVGGSSPLPGAQESRKELENGDV